MITTPEFMYYDFNGSSFSYSIDILYGGGYTARRTNASSKPKGGGVCSSAHKIGGGVGI